MHRDRIHAYRRYHLLHLFLFFILFLQLIQLDGGLISSPISITAAVVAPIEALRDPTDHIRMVVGEIHSERRNILRGVDQILVSPTDLQFLHEDGHSCNAPHILGAYAEGNIFIKDSGDQLNERTLYHELGHNVWHQLSTEQQEHWTTLNEHTKTFVTGYAKKNKEEDFAETFACFHLNFSGCSQRVDEDKWKFVVSLD